MLAAGLHHKEIAAATGRSVETVNKRVQALRRKLSVKTDAELILVAIRHGFLNANLYLGTPPATGQGQGWRRRV